MEENNQKHSSGRESLSFQRLVSETMRLGILLALSGGLMDAYSYLFRGEVFANAQTGNILLCSVALSQGEWGVAVQYAFPVLAFGLGILIVAIGKEFPAADREGSGWINPAKFCKCHGTPPFRSR